MPLLTTPAIVLASMKLGEADKLVTFFTEKKGKVKGVAAGARRMKSRFGAALEPFSQINLILFEKGGEKLSRVNQTDIVHSFQPLREDWEKIKRASQMVHLVQKMTPEEDPNLRTYRLLREGLAALEQGNNLPLSSLLFVIKLTHCSGYQPRFDQCLKCKAPPPPERVQFSLSEGGVVCSRCVGGDTALAALSPGTLAFLRATQRIDYKTAHRFRPPLATYKEIETIFGDHLAYTAGITTHAKIPSRPGAGENRSKTPPEVPPQIRDASLSPPGIEPLTGIAIPELKWAQTLD